MDVPNSATELAQIARSGNGQDVFDVLEAMTAKHGPGITALMLYSAGKTLERERLVFEVPDEWLQTAFDAIGRSGGADGDEQMRHVLAAVLPLAKQQFREQIAAELEQEAYKEAVRDINGTECTETKVLLAAARMVRGGGNG